MCLACLRPWVNSQHYSPSTSQSLRAHTGSPDLNSTSTGYPTWYPTLTPPNILGSCFPLRVSRCQELFPQVSMDIRYSDLIALQKDSLSIRYFYIPSAVTEKQWLLLTLPKGLYPGRQHTCVTKSCLPKTTAPPIITSQASSHDRKKNPMYVTG